MYTFSYINKLTQFGKTDYSLLIFKDGVQVYRENVFFNGVPSEEELDAFANSIIDNLELING